jgi:2-dehydro-3-deoxyglucarate aldolase/4-hydroxy-2-oxoheptanedioate aldolase
MAAARSFPAEICSRPAAAVCSADRSPRAEEARDDPADALGNQRSIDVRDNPVKKTLARGGRARGTMIFECFAPGMPQIVSNAGAEFVLYDMEHTGLGFETLKSQFASCRGHDVVPMVRVPRGEYHFIARALDIGALGVMVPMVATRAEAEFHVSCARYPPQGRRGAAFGFAHDDYLGGDVGAKMAAAHARTLMIAQIETDEGLRNVEEIAAVPGIDALWIGQFDLTNFMGIPAQFQHRDYLAAVDRIVAACNAHGKAAGILATDEAWAHDYAAKGFRLMAYGIDQLLLQNALRRGLDVLRDAFDAATDKGPSK